MASLSNALLGNGGKETYCLLFLEVNLEFIKRCFKNRLKGNH